MEIAADGPSDYVAETASGHDVDGEIGKVLRIMKVTEGQNGLLLEKATYIAGVKRFPDEFLFKPHDRMVVFQVLEESQYKTTWNFFGQRTRYQIYLSPIGVVYEEGECHGLS